MQATFPIQPSRFATGISQFENENRTQLKRTAVFAVCLTVAVASLSLLPVWVSDFRLWSTDPLRGIGGFFPLVALAGVIAAWRRTGWQNAGTWWGLALAVFAMAGATLFSSDSLFTFLFHHQVRLLHPGMATFLYGIGATLLFGGPRLVRVAIAPLCLLLIVNPVPEPFQRLVDMPLQILSANTARGFAHAIGLEPTGDQLRMMFAPNFGMMIVPGCNGLRGAITLGYLAMVYGYIRRLSPRALALLTVGGVLLGYLLNLLRLCLLVCYYRLGLSVTSIQSYGTQVDYVIGVSLFLSATLVIGLVAGLYFERNVAATVEPTQIPEEARKAVPPLVPRVALLAAGALAFFVPQARSVAAHYKAPMGEADVVAAIPLRVGPYALKQTWDESDANGNLRFVWGQYERDDSGAMIAMGVYLGGEDHLVSFSKMLQGVTPVWSGTLDAPRPNATTAHFITSFYRERETRTMDAETSCRGEVCELTGGISDGSVSVVAPHLADLFIEPVDHRLPLILREQWRVQTATGGDPDTELRSDFARTASEFVAALDLKPLLRLHS